MEQRPPSTGHDDILDRDGCSDTEEVEEIDEQRQPDHYKLADDDTHEKWLHFVVYTAASEFDDERLYEPPQQKRPPRAGYGVSANHQEQHGVQRKFGEAEAQHRAYQHSDGAIEEITSVERRPVDHLETLQRRGRLARLQDAHGVHCAHVYRRLVEVKLRDVHRRPTI